VGQRKYYIHSSFSQNYAPWVIGTNTYQSGLGELLSTTFASHGCNIAINYFNRIEPAQKVQAACEKLGVKAVIIKARND
jgi:hypothetical protein